ncbi:MAG: response regulator transcription factor [Planctomycetes bacterium]|nr:response regulator transcription factor [Planctomycetota bacterium]
MNEARVLVVEDEARIANLVCDNLEDEGYRIMLASDGDAALRAAHAGGIDLILLDVMLPHVDGFEVCRRLRAEGDRTPILFVTARDLPPDRVRGLMVGGDDYLVKPFQLDELLARVHAILRRKGWSGRAQAAQVQVGNGTVDFERGEATCANGSIEPLNRKELGILRLLVEAHGGVVSRTDILTEVWGDEVDPTPRTVDNFVVRLRKKFESDPAEPQYLLTMRGVGYRLREKGALRTS